MYEEPIPGHQAFDDKKPVLIFGFEDAYAIITEAGSDGKLERVNIETITVDWRYIDGAWHDLNEAVADLEAAGDDEGDSTG